MTNQELLQSVCEDIYQATGIKPVLYNADMQVLYAHPMSMGRFCTAVRQSPALMEKCLSCDRAGLARCREDQDICIYQCHMGLTEAAAPILEDGRVMGYLLFGQLLSAGSRENVCRQIDAAPEIRDKAALKSEIAGMEEISDTKLRAAARLMGMCACYVRLHRLLRTQQESLAGPIDDYIKRNLADPGLGISSICEKFGISRGKLYLLSRQAFEMGITEHIRALRLRRAAEYLRTTRWPLCRIAEETGISDGDYLTKLIKKTTGCTPRQIRENKIELQGIKKTEKTERTE